MQRLARRENKYYEENIVMTMTKSMTKTKTKTKTKSGYEMTGFPSEYWLDQSLEQYLGLPNVFRTPAWKHLNLARVPSSDRTRQELTVLLNLQNDREERERRRPEIEEEATDTTPKFRRILLYGLGSYTSLLVEAMNLVGAIVVAHYKYRFNRPRPSQLEPALRPMIDVPGHPSFPSGHATQMYLVAQALSNLVRNHDIGVQIFQIAERVAFNREWAGLHYPSDTVAGKQLAFEIYPLVEDAYRDTFQMAAEEWR
jgi:hypothetical protein